MLKPVELQFDETGGHPADAVAALDPADCRLVDAKRLSEVGLEQPSISASFAQSFS